MVPVGKQRLLTLQKCENTPTYVQKRYYVVHWGVREQKHERQLADDCADRIHGLEFN